MNATEYLHRIGVNPDSVHVTDLRTLERLQRAHVTSVPFENLSIVGDPYGSFEGAEIALSVPKLYDKIVDRRRGGYCFELNGLFCWLLSELGYDADRIAARVVGDDGARPPANHHSIAVDLDRRYVVDVGLGVPKMRRPIPIDGRDVVETTECAWRIGESDRPDAEYLVQTRSAPGDEWEPRYLFTDRPRELGYFRATNDYLQTAPESTFTGNPIVNIATETGYVKCSEETLTVIDGGTTTEHDLTAATWHETLERYFGVCLRDDG